MYACVSCSFLVPVEGMREHPVPWSYRELLATMWALGTELGPLQEHKCPNCSVF